MCPSFRATREEKHATRGRVHLLFEMLRGAAKDLWRDSAVKESLDLCLSCKGCKSDCPVGVDLAAYSMGLIPIWAAAAARAPRLANFLTQTPVLSGLTKALAGIDPRRRLPAFASDTFRRRFARRPVHRNGGKEVMIWADTFTEHFHPDIGEAACDVLEQAGFALRLSPGGLCCGRPFYDFGMLGLAKRYLRRLMAGLRGEIERGIPILVLEPSCASVFRDELINLFPQDADARRLSRQTFVLAEFLARDPGAWSPPRLRGRVLVQPHCHQRSLIGIEPDRELLRSMGLEVTVLDAGCCGMAGAFGLEKGERCDVSLKIARQGMLAALEAQPPGARLLADGFSCREQLSQCAAIHSLHLAQLLRSGLRLRS